MMSRAEIPVVYGTSRRSPSRCGRRRTSTGRHWPTYRHPGRPRVSAKSDRHPCTARPPCPLRPRALGNRGPAALGPRRGLRPRTVPRSARQRPSRHGQPAHSLAIAILRLTGHASIAAALRYHARQPAGTVISAMASTILPAVTAVIHVGVGVGGVGVGVGGVGVGVANASG